MRDVILVVTPSFNGAEYLEETILSIVQQRGNFDIHYHLQDGGSTDGTLGIARTWVECLRDNGGQFHGGAPVEMTCVSEPDSSMYDAIQAGFDSLFRKLGSLEGRRVAMTWINADDIFTAGSFRTVMSYFSLNPERPWVTGIPSIMIANGTIADVRDPPYTYCRRHLALGRYDGRTRPFFQQEGTFWTEPLWSRAGGLNRSLRLAGDWDLWRRMARHAPVVTLRAVLAHHRRRPGQLSAEMAKYYKEVDNLRRLDEGQPESVPDEGDIGWAAGWNPDINRWSTYQVNMGGAQEMLDVKRLDEGPGLRAAFSDPTWPVWIRDVSGVSDAEPWGRWSDAALAPSVRIRSIRPIPGNTVVRLRFSVLNPSCNPVVVTIGTQRFELTGSTDVNDFVIHANPDRPIDVIDIRPAASFSPKEEGWSQDARRIGIAIHAIEIAIRPDSPSA